MLVSIRIYCLPWRTRYDMTWAYSYSLLWFSFTSLTYYRECSHPRSRFTSIPRWAVVNYVMRLSRCDLLFSLTVCLGNKSFNCPVMSICVAQRCYCYMSFIFFLQLSMLCRARLPRLIYTIYLNVRANPLHCTVVQNVSQFKVLPYTEIMYRYTQNSVQVWLPMWKKKNTPA